MGKRSLQSDPSVRKLEKAGGEPSAKRGWRRHQVRDEDVIGATDIEVERQDEDDVEEESEHERSPLDEISKKKKYSTDG